MNETKHQMKKVQLSLRAGKFKYSVSTYALITLQSKESTIQHVTTTPIVHRILGTTEVIPHTQCPDWVQTFSLDLSEQDLLDSLQITVTLLETTDLPWLSQTNTGMSTSERFRFAMNHSLRKLHRSLRSLRRTSSSHPTGTTASRASANSRPYEDIVERVHFDLEAFFPKHENEITESQNPNIHLNPSIHRNTSTSTNTNMTPSHPNAHRNPHTKIKAKTLDILGGSLYLRMDPCSSSCPITLQKEDKQHLDSKSFSSSSSYSSSSFGSFRFQFYNNRIIPLYSLLFPPKQYPFLFQILSPSHHKSTHVTDDPSSFQILYTSVLHEKNANHPLLFWNENEIDLHTLCNHDLDRPFVVSIYSQKTHRGKRIQMGNFETSVNTLRIKAQQKESVFQLWKKGRLVCEFYVHVARIHGIDTIPEDTHFNQDENTVGSPIGMNRIQNIQQQQASRQIQDTSFITFPTHRIKSMNLDSENPFPSERNSNLDSKPFQSHDGITSSSRSGGGGSSSRNHSDSCLSTSDNTHTHATSQNDEAPQSDSFHTKTSPVRSVSIHTQETTTTSAHVQPSWIAFTMKSDARILF